MSAPDKEQVAGDVGASPVGDRASRPSAQAPSDRAVAADAAEPVVSALRASIPSAGYAQATWRDDEATVHRKMAQRLAYYEATDEQPRPTAERMCATCPFRGAKADYRQEAALIPAQDWPCHTHDDERCRGHWLAQARFGRPSPETILAVAQAIEARRAATGTGAVHESAVAESDAPNPHLKDQANAG